MDTIIIKPKTTIEYKEVLAVLRKLKIETEIHKVPSKEEVLKNIEKGAKSASDFLKGKLQLQEAKDLLREL